MKQKPFTLLPFKHNFLYQPLENNFLASICLGVALSSCCGFRVFVPMVAASIAGYSNLIHLPAEMQWMAGLPAIICFSTAALLEIGAYYIPFLDNILDTVSTPLAFLAGSSIAASILPIAEDEPLMRWGVGALSGGISAGTIQAGMGLLRLFTTKATVGTGNAVVASGENIAAFTGSILSF